MPARRPPQVRRPIGTLRFPKGVWSSLVVGSGACHFEVGVASITQGPGHLSTEVGCTEFFAASMPVCLRHTTFVHYFLQQPKAPHRSLTTIHRLLGEGRSTHCRQSCPRCRIMVHTLCTQGPRQNESSVAILAQELSIDRLVGKWSTSLKLCT